MPFQKGNQFGGPRPGAGRKTSEWYAAKREVFNSKIDDEAVASCGEMLSLRLRSGDVPAAAVLLPFLLGKPPDPAQIELYEARADLLRAQTANEKIVGQKLKAELAVIELEKQKLQSSIEHERLVMEELRKRMSLYFAQFVTVDMFQQFTNAYMQRALGVLQGLKPEQFADLAADPDGLEKLKAMLGTQFETAVEATMRELPAYGEGDTLDTLTVA